MNYLHYEVQVGGDDIVEVTLDNKANVRLLDDANYARYKRGEQHRYYGGQAQVSPVHLKPPHPGRWHVVIDFGGFAGKVRASVNVVSAVGHS